MGQTGNSLTSGKANPYLRWVLWLLYTLVAVRLEHRPLMHLGQALALFGIVVATVLVFQQRLSAMEYVAWSVLSLCLLGSEFHQAWLFHEAEGTFLVCSVEPDGRAHVRRIGPARLRDVTMRVIDAYELHDLHARRADNLSEFQAAVQTVPLGNFLADTDKDALVKPLQAHGGHIHYQVFFTADTGRWWEAIDLEPEGTGWSHALRVWRFRRLAPVMLYQNSDTGSTGILDGPDGRWTADML